ncbi:MAG: response regulator [Pseudomonadota bacterium]
MPTFERSSLNQKLTLISLLSTGTALFIVFIAFAATSVFKHRNDEAMQLSSFAGVIGANSIDALLFKDKKQAENTLAALKAKVDISSATLFDRNNDVFARYSAPGGDAPADLDAANAEGRQYWARTLRLYHPIMANGYRVGILMLEADLGNMWLDIAHGLGAIAAAMAASLAVATLLGSRVKRSIAEPLNDLIATAREVSRSQDYSLRIAYASSDELGQLVDSFNAMLAQIEGRGSALAHHRDELERQVGVRTAQLEKAKDAAESASRAKSAFLATMSHEIRTPMNGVLGMTEMLLGTALSETQRNYTSMVRRSGEHLLVIINDILDFSKIEAGKLTVEYIHFNLWDLLDDIDKVYAPQAQARQLALDCDIANDIPVAIVGDPNRLRQVMANLLGNAIKFTERGRILLKLRVVAENPQAVTLRFEVHDTGIGVSREARARIFEAFSQADSSTTRKYGGTGLGLAISKQLVELMGGTIGVDNALTQGSVFWFTVSFDKRRVEPGEALPHCEGLRTLIVDEHSTSGDALRGELANWRIAADVAASAIDGYERLRAAAGTGTPYDVAIIDMDLARTSGLALAASIKADPAIAPTRLIVLASERTAADPVQRREAGIAYQLIKPARGGDLAECLVLRSRVQPPAPQSPAPAALPALGAGLRRKVLLAEDNPVNVEVATVMLASLELDVDCARNGAEALEAARRTRYDAILMDCQMPVMDGFAATGEIRRHLRAAGQARKLPIIAITANALAGDREACLAAGMDDYLSKPFTRQELNAVLGRWIALPVAATAHHADRLPPAPAAHDVVNIGALAHIRALSHERGDALVQKVIMAYFDDTPQHLQTLRQAIAGLDPNNLRRAAHSLKSSSANVGAETLAQMCKEMETLGRTQTTEGASGILTEMEQEFLAVRQSLSAILEKET